MYSANAIIQLTAMAIYSGVVFKFFKCPYQANVINKFEITSKKIVFIIKYFLVPLTLKKVKPMKFLKIFSIISILLSSKEGVTKMKLEVGQKAPSVSALNESNQMVNLEEIYKKNKYVMVYFYPKADTPGCTAQACSLRDAYVELQKKGVAIYGVSTDSVEDQKKFKDKYRLPFELLSDKDKEVAKAFDVGVTLGFASRQAFLIHDGQLVWLDRKASTKEQAHDVLKYLEGK